MIDSFPDEVIYFSVLLKKTLQRNQLLFTIYIHLQLFPYRNIQTVLRLYKSQSEILLGFDVDSCCVGFDEKKFGLHFS